MKRVTVQGRAYWRIESNEIAAVFGRTLPASSGVSHLTWHWTAGPYDVGFRDYQILIGGDYVLVSQTLLAWAMHQHTWRRNGGNIGLSFMAMANATERNPGPAPITRQMLEMGANVTALLVRHFKLGWPQVVDHAYWAQVDGYPGQRWDIRWAVPWEKGETAYAALVRKAKWYYAKQAPHG